MLAGSSMVRASVVLPTPVGPRIRNLTPRAFLSRSSAEMIFTVGVPSARDREAPRRWTSPAPAQDDGGRHRRSVPPRRADDRVSAVRADARAGTAAARTAG